MGGRSQCHRNLPSRGLVAISPQTEPRRCRSRMLNAGAADQDGIPIHKEDRRYGPLTTGNWQLATAEIVAAGMTVREQTWVRSPPMVPTLYKCADFEISFKRLRRFEGRTRSDHFVQIGLKFFLGILLGIHCFAMQ